MKNRKNNGVVDEQRIKIFFFSSKSHYI